MEDESDTGLPTSIESAWGLRSRPSKGPKRGLTLDQIVATALLLAENDGLAAVSMANIATALGVSTMSLYRYVAAKDELLDLMLDSVYGRPPIPASSDEWRGPMAELAWAQHVLFRAHQWVLRIPVSKPPTTPNQIAWLEAGLICLQPTQLTETEKLSAILLINGFVRSEASLVAEINAGFRATGATSPQAVSSYGRLLARLTTKERFPALRAVIEAGVFETPDSPDSEFKFGLERILEGIDALVDQRSAITGTSTSVRK